MEAEALLHTQVDTLPQEKTKSVSDIESDVEAKTLDEELHDTLAKYGGRNN